MAESITEQSESDAVTTYRITGRVLSCQTPFQKIELVDSAEYGRMLFLDGELQSATTDEAIYHECLVHPAIAGIVASGRAARGLRVLVVGGGEGATVREVLRWGVDAVDWVDIDLGLVAACQDHLGWPGIDVLGDSRVCFFAADIRTVLPDLGEFDVIVLDLPDPDGETGWLYSPEFFRDLQRHLAGHGAIVTHCGPVRPGVGLRVGAGFQRLLRESGLEMLRPEGFYHVGIPSFQGEWGFWIWRPDGGDPFEFLREGREPLPVLPEGLRILDWKLMQSWADPPRMWVESIRDAVA
jgi:spermidine synthase